jgi:hypothetical protein
MADTMNPNDTEDAPSLRLPRKRPLHDLLLTLPMLMTFADGGIDFDGSDPDTLVSIAENAADTTRTMNMGISAIGHLLAISSVEIATQEVAGEAIAALGFMIKEVADLAALADYLGTSARRYIHDYSP